MELSEFARFFQILQHDAGGVQHALYKRGESLSLKHQVQIVTDTLRNNKGTYLDCESSEPITVEPMQITAKMIDKKFPSQELATFERGEMVNLEGYAKFRDGNSIKRFQITISTIPSM